MPSRAAALLGDLGFEVSSRVSLMRSSYDRLTVIPLSRRIIYVGDVGLFDVIFSFFLLVWSPRFQSLLIMGWCYSIPEHRL